jgi:hypothetical protein
MGETVAADNEPLFKKAGLLYAKSKGPQWG